ncbi:MAG TPA: hypothetical protein VLU73_04535 [Methylococcaceae bacterium]|nr:hypothetical protein [Methylococcaceae bacterium]
MAADTVLSQELKALQEEMAASHQERSLRSKVRAPADAEVNRDSQPGKGAEEKHLVGELRELANVITEFVEEAEQNVSEHPTASVIGALVVGILIGRLLGRR